MPVFGLVAAVLAVALAVTLAAGLRARRALGVPLWRAGRARAARAAVLALLAASALAFAGVHGALPLSVGGALALAGAITLARPGTDEEACGARGVRRGWTACGFHELDEWRLAGEHLRFRVGPRWLAVRLPAEHHAPTRERLLQAVPERESRLA